MGAPVYEKAGLVTGGGAVREVAAFLLDSATPWHGACGVPATGLCEVWHPALNNVAHAGQHTLGGGSGGAPPPGVVAKVASLQVFLQGADASFYFLHAPEYEAQKVALLDLRLLNADRNDDNVLSRTEAVPIEDAALLSVAGARAAIAAAGGGSDAAQRVLERVARPTAPAAPGGASLGGASATPAPPSVDVLRLHPIDHAATLPDRLAVFRGDWAWTWWPQTRVRTHPALLHALRRADAPGA